MDKNEAYNLRFPNGQFSKPNKISDELTCEWISTIKDFPKLLSAQVKNLSESELKYKYRPNGWNIKQIIHHCADSHMNSFMRFKLALTEETPTIKPYFEDRWAEMKDYNNSPIADSLKILAGLHSRWTLLLENLSDADLDKKFLHPENNEEVTLRENIGIYAWHCKHHLEHIKIARLNKYKS